METVMKRKVINYHLTKMNFSYLLTDLENHNFNRCRNGTLKTHCCDNKIEINGTCVECEDGYMSDLGEPCRACSDGYYGEKCAEICSCHGHKRCHHIFGCAYFQIWSTTTALDDTFGKTVTSGTKAETIRMEVVIYIICTACIIFVMLMCGLYKRRNGKSDININVKGNRQTFRKSEQPIENEGTYDMIDESQMIDMPSKNILDCERFSNENSSLGADNQETNCDDGYLNPYQPIVPQLNQHAYDIRNTLRPFVSPTNENALNIDTNTDEPISSVDSKRNSGYIIMRPSSCNRISNSNLHFVNKCNFVNNAVTQSNSCVATLGNCSMCTQFNNRSAQQRLSLRPMSFSDNNLTSKRYNPSTESF